MSLKYILAIIFPRSLQDRYYFPHFTDKKAEAKAGLIQAGSDLEFGSIQLLSLHSFPSTLQTPLKKKSGKEGRVKLSRLSCSQYFWVTPRI